MRTQRFPKASTALSHRASLDRRWKLLQRTRNTISSAAGSSLGLSPCRVRHYHSAQACDRTDRQHHFTRRLMVSCVERVHARTKRTSAKETPDVSEKVFLRMIPVKIITRVQSGMLRVHQAAYFRATKSDVMQTYYGSLNANTAFVAIPQSTGDDDSSPAMIISGGTCSMIQSYKARSAEPHNMVQNAGTGPPANTLVRSYALTRGPPTLGKINVLTTTQIAL